MKRRISEEELFLVITRDRLSEMFGEAGANGLTFPEICFPGTGRRRVLAACRDPRTRHDGKDARLYFNQLTRQPVEHDARTKEMMAFRKLIKTLRLLSPC